MPVLTAASQIDTSHDSRGYPGSRVIVHWRPPEPNCAHISFKLASSAAFATLRQYFALLYEMNFPRILNRYCSPKDHCNGRTARYATLKTLRTLFGLE